MHHLLGIILVGMLLCRPILAQSTPAPLLTVPHEWTISGARWHPNGKDLWTWNRRFIVAEDSSPGWQDRLRLWDGSSGDLQSEFQYRGDNVAMHLDWSAGDDRVLVYSGQSLEVWDALQGEKLFTYPYTARISGARWSADFSCILFWSFDDGSIHILDWNTRQSVFLAETGMNSDLVDASWSPDEKTILAVLTQSPGRVELWDVARSAPLLSFDYSGMIYRAAWNADGTRVLVVGDKILQLIDVATQRVVFEQRDAVYLYRADWSPDRSRVAVRVENEPRVVVWDTLIGEGVASVVHAGQADNAVFEVRWSKDSQRLLTHSAGEIALWDAATGKNLYRIPDVAQPFGMRWMSWSPDESQVLYMRSDSSIRIVNLADDQAVELELPSPLSLSLPAPEFAWKADGSQVMLAGVDNAARVWDTVSGRLLATLGHPLHTGFQSALVTEALWSPDQQLILTLGMPDYCDGSDTCPSEARLWNAP